MRARTFFVAGLTRVTRAPFRELTHTLPAPYASPNGVLGIASRHTTRPAAGSMRTRRPPIRSLTHRPPPPERAKEADVPTCTLAGAAAPARPQTAAAATTTTPPRNRLSTSLRYFTTTLR